MTSLQRHLYGCLIDFHIFTERLLQLQQRCHGSIVCVAAVIPLHQHKSTHSCHVMQLDGESCDQLQPIRETDRDISPIFRENIQPIIFLNHHDLSRWEREGGRHSSALYCHCYPFGTLCMMRIEQPWPWDPGLSPPCDPNLKPSKREKSYPSEPVSAGPPSHARMEKYADTPGRLETGFHVFPLTFSCL